MSKSSVTMSMSKMNAGLAIGVLGVLVLIGSDTYAAEPASKRKPATSARTTTAPSRAMDSTQPKLMRSSVPKQSVFRKVDGLASTTEVIESGKPTRGNLKAPQSAPPAGDELARWNYVNGWPQAAPQAGRDTVATYNFTQAWPPSAPAPKQPGNYSKAILLTTSLPGALPDAQQSGVSASTSPADPSGNTLYVSDRWIPSATKAQRVTDETLKRGMAKSPGE